MKFYPAILKIFVNRNCNCIPPMQVENANFASSGISFRPGILCTSTSYINFYNTDKLGTFHELLPFFYSIIRFSCSNFLLTFVLILFSIYGSVALL